MKVIDSDVSEANCVDNFKSVLVSLCKGKWCSQIGARSYIPPVCRLELRAACRVFVPVGGTVEPIPSIPMAGHEQPPSFSRFRVGMEAGIPTSSHVRQE